MLKLYGFSKVNAVARGHTRDLRVLWALEEMQLPFELVGMNHPAHDLSSDTGRLLPDDLAGEAQVVRWCFAALNSIEPPLLSLMVLDWTADGSCGKHREFLVGWVNRALANLERWLAKREFVATREFTVADILM